MKLKEIVIEMSFANVVNLENQVTQLFNDIGLRVQFSKHFKDRVDNNYGRESSVTEDEILKMFLQLKRRYGRQLFNAKNRPKEFIGLLKDASTNLNIPFSIDYDKVYNGLHKLNAITIMRKKNFQNDSFDNTVFQVRT